MEKQDKGFLLSIILISIGVSMYILEGWLLHDNSKYVNLDVINMFLYFKEISSIEIAYTLNIGDNIFSGIEQTIAVISMIFGISIMFDVKRFQYV
jgi:hypothetical protein